MLSNRGTINGYNYSSYAILPTSRSIRYAEKYNNFNIEDLKHLSIDASSLRTELNTNSMVKVTTLSQNTIKTLKQISNYDNNSIPDEDSLSHSSLIGQQLLELAQNITGQQLKTHHIAMTSGYYETYGDSTLKRLTSTDMHLHTDYCTIIVNFEGEPNQYIDIKDSQKYFNEVDLQPDNQGQWPQGKYDTYENMHNKFVITPEKRAELQKDIDGGKVEVKSFDPNSITLFLGQNYSPLNNLTQNPALLHRTPNYIAGADLTRKVIIATYDIVGTQLAKARIVLVPQNPDLNVIYQAPYFLRVNNDSYTEE